MGYLPCNAESAIATCDSYNLELLAKNPPRPFEIADFSFSDLYYATNGFSPGNLLGKGSHGAVYKAKLEKMKVAVAVKKCKLTHPAAAADNEVEILSGIYHPRLVNLIGCGVDSDDRKLIVVEYMPNGSLYDLLHLSEKPLSWVKRTRYALQIAMAIQFLHTSTPPVIHRDIKSSNVLIDRKFDSRLSDFSLSLRGNVEDVKVRCTPPAGTLGYLDPEYLAPGDLSTKSDVFSYGILLLEIITGHYAIDVNHSPPSVVDWAVPSIKAGDFTGICDLRTGPPGDKEALRRMAVIAARCVRSTAAKRPNMSEVVECLKNVHKKMKAQSHKCISLRRRVRMVGEDSRAGKYESLDESVEMVKNRASNCRKNNGRVSSISSTEMKSKSIGTTSEIKFMPPNSNILLESIFGENLSILRTRGPSNLEGINRDISTRQSNKGENPYNRNLCSYGLDPVKLRMSPGSNIIGNKRGVSIKVPTIRLSKSRSMGFLQSNNLTYTSHPRKFMDLL